MTRSPGITAVAVMVMLGGIVACLFGLILVLGAVLMKQTGQMPPGAVPPVSPAAIAGVEAIVFIGIGAWSIASAIGLLGLRNWARISAIILGSLLAVFGLFELMGALFVPMMKLPPPDPRAGLPPNFPLVIAIGLGLFALIQMAIGIWWLVFLSKRSAKEQFVQPGQVAPAILRPLSIVIIGWFMTVIGALALPFLMFIGKRPGLFFGFLIHGPAMQVFYVLSCGATLVAGISLLKLKPVGISIAMGVLLFNLANVTASFLMPGTEARFQTVLRESMQGNSPFPPELLSKFVWIGLLFSTLLIIVQLWFLVSDKEAYLAAASAARSTPQVV